jgi:RNA polymerase sigma factor (sigma-70 family)
VEALAVLLERYRPPLYAAAVGLLGNRADALDAVQDTFVVALLRLADPRDAAAARAWLHAVLRNLCRMRIRQHREIPFANVELADAVPGPEETLERHIMGEWVWQALDSLSADERLTVMLRHFSRCTSYDTIARVTSVPVGTVRSRLNRARRRLADRLMATASGTPMSHADLQAAQRTQWEEFYRLVHRQPVPRTYRELFAPDVDVRDPAGHWYGIEAWSAEEREAITVGVQASIVGVLASSELTVGGAVTPRPPRAGLTRRGEQAALGSCPDSAGKLRSPCPQPKGFASGPAGPLTPSVQRRGGDRRRRTLGGTRCVGSRSSRSARRCSPPPR